LLGLIWLVFFQDLTFHPELEDFVERKKYAMCVLMVIFTCYMCGFAHIVKNLVSISITPAYQLKINGNLIEKSSVTIIGEFIVSGFSFAAINVNGSKKYFLPRKALTFVPFMFYFDVKNEAIKSLKSFLDE